ncbi:hypothetical protein ID866_7674 [Astraeus odoratus]|nr:hypothetical protein ID866_7674 [Astraeus odoratus]
MSSDEDIERSDGEKELWFDDGNVVLQAEGKQFKVHRGILSAHSQIFKDMFSCPQPPDKDEIVEGCPVVHLQDSASDILHILNALYGKYNTQIARQMPMAIATAFLRLGKKYEMKMLFDEAANRLYECYPMKLPSSPPARVDSRRLTGRDPHDFQLINIAREVGLVTVLPAALYICSYSTDIEVLLDGYEWMGTYYTLSLINQRACIIGRDKHHAFVQSAFGGLFKQEREMFYSRWACRNIQCVFGFCITAIPTNPFAGWDAEWNKRFCADCVNSLKREHEQCRKKAWALLPSVFGLGNWDEVAKNATKL